MALLRGFVVLLCLFSATPSFGIVGIYERCFGVAEYASAIILKSLIPFMGFSIPGSEEAILAFEWRKGFLRYPNDDIGNPAFLVNHTQALHVFDRWFRGIDDHDYQTMLSHQHTIACIGPSGDRPYTIARNGGTYSSDQMFPGMMRHMPGIPPRSAFQSDSLAEPGPLLDSLSLLGWSVADFENINGSYRWRNPIDGIAAAIWPENLLLRQGSFSHYAPGAMNHESYLKRIADLAEDLRQTRWQHINHNPYALKTFVHKVADYYHTSINWMPFVGVNNSILMSHVNYVLRYHGFSVLPHEELDYQAFLSSTSQFRQVLWKSFLAANPRMSGVRINRF